MTRGGGVRTARLLLLSLRGFLRVEVVRDVAQRGEERGRVALAQRRLGARDHPTRRGARVLVVQPVPPVALEDAAEVGEETRERGLGVEPASASGQSAAATRVAAAAAAEHRPRRRPLEQTPRSTRRAGSVRLGVVDRVVGVRVRRGALSPRAAPRASAERVELARRLRVGDEQHAHELAPRRVAAPRHHLHVQKPVDDGRVGVARVRRGDEHAERPERPGVRRRGTLRRIRVFRIVILLRIRRTRVLLRVPVGTPGPFGPAFGPFAFGFVRDERREGSHLLPEDVDAVARADAADVERAADDGDGGHADARGEPRERTRATEGRRRVRRVVHGDGPAPGPERPPARLRLVRPPRADARVRERRHRHLRARAEDARARQGGERHLLGRGVGAPRQVPRQVAREDARIFIFGVPSAPRGALARRALRDGLGARHQQPDAPGQDLRGGGFHDVLDREEVLRRRLPSGESRVLRRV